MRKELTLPPTKDRDGFEIVPRHREHRKLQAIQPLSQAIGDFLEAMAQQGIHLAQIPEGFEHTWYPICVSTTALLAEHFEIDMDRLEREKRQMLADQRRLNQLPRRTT